MRLRSMPCPLMRNLRPGWVPGGTRSTTFLPSTVHTRMLVPSIACTTLIGTSASRSLPSRRKKRSGCTWNVTTRSPAAAPERPGWPMPLSHTLARDYDSGRPHKALGNTTAPQRLADRL